MRTVRQGRRLPLEVVQTSFLEIFNTWLNQILANLIFLEDKSEEKPQVYSSMNHLVIL